MTTSRAQALRIAAQAADTSRRFGVDFVPVSSEARSFAAETSSSGVTEDNRRVIETKPEPAINVVVRTDGHSTEHLTTDMPRTSKKTKQAQLDDILARYIKDEPHKGFNTNFKNIVFGEGNPDADLMFVGEAPGADEDEQGRPFVGRSGQLLDKMIAAMGLSRSDVYIANVLKTRPINNATPTLDQAEKCSPYLFDQIRVINPGAIVTLGKPAAHLLLKSGLAMGQLRGRWWTFRDDRLGLDPVEYQVMPTFHPAYVLRNHTPETRGKVWSDLQQVMKKIGLPA
ncbi:MAG: uracil-DNA glycosylase [Phycisphaeraceae bacterium]|nr:uracil-DNA glycosylase [Phycisphaerales bacterium]MCB9860897.1 uracil-DNA glycosylase [Phycisphaeraceae bacterium]